MSLTAVTSFVSVIREKTVFVLRLNVRGSQRVAVPIVIIVCCVLAVGFFVAAGATEELVKVYTDKLGTAWWCKIANTFGILADKANTECHGR